MRGSVKKSALILGVLLLSIAAAGQVFPGRDSQADVPVVTERVLSLIHISYKISVKKCCLRQLNCS